MNAVQSLQADALDEQALINRTADGDDHAYARLVSKHSAVIYRFLLRMLNNETDAEDLTQETFIQLYKNRKKLRHNEQLLPYLYTIARNKAISKIRWRKVRQMVQPFDQAMESFIPADVQPAHDKLEQDRVEQKLNLAIQSLKEEYRTVVILRFFEGMPFQDIAKIMNKPEGTIKSWGFRAEKELRHKLSDIAELWGTQS